MPPILTRRHLLASASAALALPALAEPAPPTLAELVARVDRARLRADVEALAAFPTRWTLAPDFPAVERWVEQALGRAAGVPARLQAYPHRQAGTRHNVLSGDPLDPRGLVLVGAHFDSFSETPQSLAPGANDNATGVAALLEACRILSPVRLRKTIVFAAFSGEEQDFQGAGACAALARQQGWPIALMLNLDMLGHHPETREVPFFVEYDRGNRVAGNDAAAERYGRQATLLARAFTDLRIENSDIWDSDYMPFEAQGYPCIGFYDGGVASAEYHSTTDLPERVDFQRLEQATRLLVATLAVAAG